MTLRVSSRSLKDIFSLTLCTRCKTLVPCRSTSGSVRRERKRREKAEIEIEYKSEKQEPVKRVYVWGQATTGALGVRSFLKPERRRPPVKTQFRPTRLRFMDANDIEVYQVACGYGFTLFTGKRRRRNIVLACGINTDSQLGYHEYPRNSGRVLDYLIEPARVDIPETGDSGSDVLQMSCGRAHSMFITENGVYSQGNNSYGQCGRPVVEGEIFSKVSNIQRIEGLPDDISKVVCGQDHTLFLTSSGEVYSCGLGADGQTGLGTFTCVGTPTRVKGDIENVKIVDIASKSDCVLALSDSGDVFGWGNSEYRQLSMVTDETQVNVPKHLPIRDCGKITTVVTGGSMCALRNDRGHIFVWGYGILGQGPNVEMLKRPSLLPPPLFGCNEFNPKVKVTKIKCGMSHFAAVTNSGDLYTWGNGKYGCLGLLKQKKQFFPLKVALPAAAYNVECGVDHTVVLCRSFT